MKYQQKGFALLYAILLTGAILSVGVILMNIITKQLLFSSINRNSEISYYYAANSGRECLQYVAKNNSDSFYEFLNENNVSFKQSATFTCFGESIKMEKDSVPGNIIAYKGKLDLDKTTIDLSIKFNKSCLLHEGPCLNDSNGKIFKKALYFIQVDGSNLGSENRVAKRTAIFVRRLL